MIIYNIFRKNREIRIILNYNTQKLITTPLQNLQNKTKKNRILRFILQYPLTIQIMFVLLRTDLFVFLRTIDYIKNQKQTDLIYRNSNKKRIMDLEGNFEKRQQNTDKKVDRKRKKKIEDRIIKNKNIEDRIMEENKKENEEEIARIAKAISNPTRVSILNFLAQQTTCYFGKIYEELPIAKATVSQHLKELKNAGLIQGEIEGPKVKYCINKENWEKAGTLFSDFFKQPLSKNKSCCD